MPPAKKHRKLTFKEYESFVFGGPPGSKKKMVDACPACGKSFKSAAGLQGHADRNVDYFGLVEWSKKRNNRSGRRA